MSDTPQTPAAAPAGQSRPGAGLPAGTNAVAGEVRRRRSRLYWLAWEAAKVMRCCLPLPGNFTSRTLLRLFGARIGRGARVCRSAFVSYPFQLELGPGSQVWQDCWFESLAPITLGKQVAVSRGVTFMTAGHRPFDPEFTQVARPITVGDNVWIGCNATILGGVTIGEGAVIGAAALVTRDVEPFTVVAGVPAKVIRRRDG